MKPTLPIPVYVLNLDRSADRLSAVLRSAADFDVQVVRVPAVDGRALTPEQEAEIDLRTFTRVNGKKVLPAEIGCYLSHLRALEQIARGPDEFAVIVEDDVQFTAAFSTFLNDLVGVRGWDLVKLVSHRTTGFISYLPSSDTYAIGRCLHGPLGSSAAYVVRREAAAKLLKSLRPMVVPYDVALERGWAYGLAVFTVDKPVVAFGKSTSTIASGKAYRATKFPFYRRIGTLIYRAIEYVRRAAYAMPPVSLSRGRDPAS